MKTPHPPRPVTGLRARLSEAEETLRAIRNGEVDTMVGTDKKNRQVFSLESADHAYQMLIESMNEGALTLTTDKMILYANQCFAKMVRRPLEQVIGTSFKQFLAVADRRPLRALLKSAGKTGSKVQLVLHAGNGSRIPVLISIRPLASDGGKLVTVGMVVTDMTEARRNEELLRELSHRLVQAQEMERGSLSRELHDHITQLLCAVVVRSQLLADKISDRDAPARQEAQKLCAMLGHAAGEVERISRNLRPSVLRELGLAAVVRSEGAAFAKRTGVPLQVTCGKLSAKLPAETELTFYRILQEALKNVEQHARAKQVAAHLTQSRGLVKLVIQDDGIGFDAERPPSRRKARRGFGLIHLRERVASVGGVLIVKSSPGQGTTIHTQIPIRPGARRGGGSLMPSAEIKFLNL